MAAQGGAVDSLSEKLEQLRALENNIAIKMLISSFDSPAVDTETDLIRVDKLIGKFLEKN